MGRATKLLLLALAVVLIMLLVSQCSYDAGRWIGAN